MVFGLWKLEDRGRDIYRYDTPLERVLYMFFLGFSVFLMVSDVKSWDDITIYFLGVLLNSGVTTGELSVVFGLWKMEDGGRYIDE